MAPIYQSYYNHFKRGSDEIDNNEIPKTATSTFMGQKEFTANSSVPMNDTVFLKIDEESQEIFNVKQEDFDYINRIHKINHIESNKNVK